MLKDSIEHARDDVHLRALTEQRVEGERMIEATESALREDADLLSAAEASEIRSAIEILKHAVGGNDHGSIKAQIGRLNRLTEPFAGRRMDRIIKRALTGRNVTTLSQ